MKSVVVLIAACYVGLTALWTGIGLLVTGPLVSVGLGDLDRNVTNWLVDHRTPALDFWSNLGSMAAQTVVKLVVTLLVALAMFLAWRSWREPFLLCFALVLEATVFITVTWLVDRPRPEVVHLDDVSVGTSFPSGHAAAAAAYGAILVVVFERTQTRWIRTLSLAVAVALPLVVGISRMYRGVHYLTDVVAGLLLGWACVAAAVAVTRRTFDSQGRLALRQQATPPKE